MIETAGENERTHSIHSVLFSLFFLSLSFSTHMIYILFRYVSDTDFRLQFTTLFQLFRGLAQSTGNCCNFVTFAGTCTFLFACNKQSIWITQFYIPTLFTVVFLFCKIETTFILFLHCFFPIYYFHETHFT